MIRSFTARLFATILTVLVFASAWAQTPPPAEDTDAPKAPEALSADTYELVGQNPISQYDALREHLRKMIKGTRNPEAYGIYVEETHSPLVLIDHNGSSGFNPVEAQILLTSAAALELFGGQHRFRTTVTPAGTLQNGVLTGHLIVRGTGDPTIGTTFYMEKQPRKFNAFETFEDWAHQIKAAGINTVAGALVLDDTAFDDQLVAPEWPQDRSGHPIVAQVSALSFRDNCVDIYLDAGWRKRTKVKAEMFPGIYATLHSGVLASPKGSEPDVKVRRRGDSNIVEVLGTIPVRSEYRTRASIHDPSLYFGTILRKVLVEEGVDVYRSKPRKRVDYKDDAALTSLGSPVVSHFSPRLNQIVPPMIRRQRFETADHVFKALGYSRERKGSFKTGAQAVDYFFRISGIDKG
ncbi:MAG: D-alanyl-D-alanine carboxypeptidase/D-alanyl-D-alanine-endopeptidase, partial [Candidatus Sumerlaeota bacterium]